MDPFLDGESGGPSMGLEKHIGPVSDRLRKKLEQFSTGPTGGGSPDPYAVPAWGIRAVTLPEAWRAATASK